MKGKYHIVVQNNRLRYELDVKRNITIIRGDSATGKTTLLNMIQSAYEIYGIHTYLDYSKSNLNKSYLSEKNKSAILKEIEGIEF